MMIKSGSNQRLERLNEVECTSSINVTYDISFGYVYLTGEDPAIALEYINGYIDRGILVGDRRVYGMQRPDWDIISRDNRTLWQKLKDWWC